VAHVVLGDGPVPAENLHEVGFRRDPHGGGHFAAGVGQRLGVGAAGDVGAAGAAHHHREQHAAVGRPPAGEDRGGPEHAQDVAPLRPGSQKAEAVGRGHPAPGREAQRHHRHGRVGERPELGRQLRQHPVEKPPGGVGRGGRDERVRRQDFAVVQRHGKAAAVARHVRNPAAEAHPGAEARRQIIGDHIQAGVERREHAAGPGGTRLAFLTPPPLLPGQAEHGPEQPAVVALQLEDAREGAPQAHGLRVAGEDAHDHGVQEPPVRLLAQPPAGERRQRLLGLPAVRPLPQLGDDAQLARPG